MKTRITVSAVVVLAVAFGVAIATLTRGTETPAANAAVTPAPSPKPAQVAKAPATIAPEPVKPAPAAETGAPVLTPEPAPAPPAEQPPSQPSNTLTSESLKNTRWVDGPVDVVFLPDGRWQMNGRICAKWIVEGSRVKIFDDNGEVHYVDIVGDTLEFNGKKIGRAS